MLRQSVARSLVVLVAIVFGLWSPTGDAKAAPSAEQRCQATKNRTVGKYVACKHNAEAKLATSGKASAYTQEILKCEYKMATAWELAQAKAAAAGTSCLDAPLTKADFQASIDMQITNVANALDGLGLDECQPVATSTPNPTPPAATPSPTPPARFVDNGDGTISDSQTGLQWEKKDTVCPGMHCVADAFRWSGFTLGPADGPLFTTFLTSLNSSNFAGSSDWRLPTLSELQSILVAICSGGPCVCPQGNTCIDGVFGPTGQIYYWTGTQAPFGPQWAWSVGFLDGIAWQEGKDRSFPVRAVRGP